MDPLESQLRVSAAELDRLADAVEQLAPDDPDIPVSALRDLANMGRACADTLAVLSGAVRPGQQSALTDWLDTARLAVQLCTAALLRRGSERAS